GLAQAVGDFEESLALLGAPEHEGRCLEDGALDRALGPFRIVAVAHHQAFRLQFPAVIGFFPGSRSHVRLLPPAYSGPFVFRGPLSRRNPGPLPIVSFPIPPGWKIEIARG